ncbi:UDP-N-acetylglucosamine pyrophosphorylase [Desulfonispora thiosulfatigenes DSM 11270]|uniref:Bifunctional protein GlmU n=1 Tax=Desulfonispora thiosulfatigenes DSM 11270 TaxID=656914 RepID=A0A1W1UZJ1_DESTI|nr:bifunctional UDP-N-acetylglucosamine diphosphorylase/glucosamine-1-phosphate N-acetyltransferase GlmU [Desulfonispora thiosulfatigenes]SMB86532.1 UDP-N-acetylglucosamine pyrophosphorylase [Desulfonispora thiosulfatigenes DSM 11270]
MNSAAIILAAGKGTRMKSELPKVLHKVLGEPMLNHVLDALEEAKIKRKIVVLGHGAKEVEEILHEQIEVTYQKQQLGTGHAVMQAENLLNGKEDNVLVVCGDTPLLRSETLTKLIESHKENQATITILTAKVDDPTGYGRIIRDENGVQAIIEEKDANVGQKAIDEINTGAYCFKGNFLLSEIVKLDNNNAQGEYYLTDLIKKAVSQNLKVDSYIMEDHIEALGINNRIQLAEAESILRKRILDRLMLEGTTLIDPLNTYIGKNVKIGQDTIIYPGCILEGTTSIGQNAIIGPNTRIINSEIMDSVNIQSSLIVDSKVGSGCNIGPFAYLRPNSVLEDNVKVGDFVEIKNSTINKGSKIPHLSYIGDSVVGSKVNIGCGTITCNYDGKVKSKTVINDGAFIGSNTNLVAPVTIGQGAFIGAGSTITKDVPEGSLGLGRSKQKNIDDWSKKS